MENTTCKSHFSTRKRQRANFIGSRTRNLACGDPRSLKRPNRQPFSPNISNQSNIFKCPAETYKLLFESTKVHCVLYQESLDKCFSRFRFQVHLQKAILLNPLSTKRFTNSNSLRIIKQKPKTASTLISTKLFIPANPYFIHPTQTISNHQNSQIYKDPTKTHQPNTSAMQTHKSKIKISQSKQSFSICFFFFTFFSMAFCEASRSCC